jgi:predicted Zn-dependent peptidase
VESLRLDDRVHRTVAPSGLTILSEGLPSVRSVALGCWVRAASAHEARPQMGVSHLLEHMVFKGTERRSARQIALDLEARGGSLDAWTGRDHTSFQAHALDRELALAADLVTDLVRRPLLRPGDLDLERNVVLEEINGVQDAPEDLVFDHHSALLWGGHPYGFPILGTAETVAGLGSADLRATHARGYYPGNCVIAAAGALEHERLLDALAAEGWFDGPAGDPLPPAAPAPAHRGLRHHEVRDGQQAHLVIGTDTFPHRDPRRLALSLLVNAFGGGMSSRLFQRIREELGLAYSVYAWQQFYVSAGQLGVYVGTAPGTADRAEAAILAEFGRLAAEGLASEELLDAKRQLQGQLVLALESPASRMHRLASFALHGEPWRSVDDLLQEIEAVPADTLAAVAAEFFAPERQTVLRLGPER